MISEEKEYRPCVGIMLFNKQGNIFIGKRFDSDSYWQMPQGGVDEGEELEQAALRELLEEVGTDEAEVVAQNKEWIYYNLPEEVYTDMLEWEIFWPKAKVVLNEILWEG